MLYPFTFEPIFKERVWGGRRLAELYKKPCPAGALIGESWEISDRPGDVSVIANGPLAGRNLRWLMEHHGEALLGYPTAVGHRFPLLIKLLDAREKLSLQVHPPAHASLPGAEAKTEMWYIAEADPGAELYVGLKRGVTRAGFQQALERGAVAECFHRIPVRVGDAMFLPSGRVHAIGAGLVIFEIQQNSDTTFRVYDWNRAGLDGKPRALHVAESLASIDFDDFEPALVPAQAEEDAGWKVRLLTRDALFTVERWVAAAQEPVTLPQGKAIILAGVEDVLAVQHADTHLSLKPGEFCLIPATLEQVRVTAATGSAHLRVLAGQDPAQTAA